MFNIKDLYPSLKGTLLTKAMNFAKKRVNIPNRENELLTMEVDLFYTTIMNHEKKRQRFIWYNYGAYDGAEVCELVGTFFLYKLSQKCNKNNIDLYRDDDLAIFKNISGPKSEKVIKNFQKMFKENELDIIIQCNMKVVNYLDVTLNLENSTYCPYQKENNQIKYIDTESNHPPSIIKQLPINIESQLSSLSSSEEIFNNSATPYQNAFDKSGHKHKHKYQANISTNTNKKPRKRNIIWFNPPYIKNVKTNIG